MHLQMCCLEYLKNFYNDYEFQSVKYAHLLPKVLPICNQLMIKYSTADSKQAKYDGSVPDQSKVMYMNYLVINEILELYRLIVEKYASYNSLEQLDGGANQGNSIICELAIFLN